ncbi:MAG: bacterioferritin [Proteobacteria bacterium]|nr:MAG: bacterioferritin [Pseudomonadota bacterium]
MSEFVLDIENIRHNAREHIKKGAVTADYQGNKEAILKILDSSLATEWLCVLRYTQHAKAAEGIHAEPIAAHFKEHAAQEQDHADKLASRIKQLGGTPNLDPASFSKRGHTEYKECTSLVEMIKENLIAERIAIDVYGAAIRYIGENDPTTRRMLEEILAVEEEHADEMADLLKAYDPHEKLH